SWRALPPRPRVLRRRDWPLGQLGRGCVYPRRRSGVYFDPERLHVLDHKGEFLSVRGPLNIARPVQGWPVIVQAGASDAGRQLAAETAEMIFASGGKLAAARQYCADVRERAKKVGRDPDHAKLLPGCLVVGG